MNIIWKRNILQIQIWILFMTPWVTNMTENAISKNVHKYIQRPKYIQIFENSKNPGYC